MVIDDNVTSRLHDREVARCENERNYKRIASVGEGGREGGINRRNRACNICVPFRRRRSCAILQSHKRIETCKLYRRVVGISSVGARSLINARVKLRGTLAAVIGGLDSGSQDAIIYTVPRCLFFP